MPNNQTLIVFDTLYPFGILKRYLLCGMLMLSTFVCFSQDKQAIIKVLDMQSDAWNRGDIDGFMQGYWHSDSLLFVSKTAPTYGWQTTLEHYKKTYPDKATMGQLKFNILKVSILDATNAFILGGWHLNRTMGDVGGYFTLWFRKIKGEWKIVCDHTS